MLAYANTAHCSKCRQQFRLEIFHAKAKGHPVGSSGRHIRRVLCRCGCRLVDTFFVFDYERVRSRTTASLLFVPLRSDRITHESLDTYRGY